MSAREFTRYAAFSLVGLMLALSIIFPVVFRYATSYAAPTAVYAVQVLDSNGLIHRTPEDHGYWSASLVVEENYPVPSLLLSTFVLLTGIPRQYTMFTPIMGLANIVYFVLARRILRDSTKASYCVLFSALYFMFEISESMPYGTDDVARATFGTMIFTFFLLAYVSYLSASNSGRNSWLILLVLFTLAIGESYYTSTVAIGVLTFLMTVLLAIVASPARQLRHYGALGITALAIFLFAYNELGGALVVETLYGGESFLDNLIRRVLVLLGIEAYPASHSTRLVQIDFLTRVTGIWIPNAVKLVAIVALAYVLFKLRPRKLCSAPPTTIWLFSLAVFLSNLSEFSYLLVAVTSPIRLLVKYSPIVLLFTLVTYISGNDCPRPKSKASLFTSLFKAFSPHKRVLLPALVLILILASVGSLRFAWYYSVGKPYAYQKAEPLSYYVLSYSSSQDPLVLAGDAYYTANIFFILSLQRKLGNAIPEPLGNDTIVLYNSLQTNNIDSMIGSMRQRDINCLLIVHGTTLWGDEWGPAVTLPRTNLLAESLSLLYDDGRSEVFCLIETDA